MAFNSLAFLIFIACFGLGWLGVKHRTQWRFAWITLGSFLFYGWWDWRFLFLLIGTGIVDFVAGIAMQRAQTKALRRLILGLSLASNLGALFIFKYAGFIGGVIDDAFGTSLVARIPAFALILPVGISFYTFQSMSYTIDIYRRKLEPTRNPLHFFAFLSLFPQLVAGPIIRATDLLWQMMEAPRTTENTRMAATRLIVLGYVQKLLIADQLAGFVDAAFANPQASIGTGFWWLVMCGFALQIYCDFAGYSNIARGLLKFMGLTIRPNFRYPYFAVGFRDFWNRWHISLSHWFRDYVYIPLGGSRMSRTRQFGALWVTFLLSGLWHGANWTFLVWGALHALYVTLERVTRWPKVLPRPLAMLFTFMLAVLAWVFFRAADIDDALHIATSMLTPQPSEHIKLHTPWDIFALFMCIELYALKFPIRRLARVSMPAARWGECALLGMALAAAVLFRGEGHGFIYFQF